MSKNSNGPASPVMIFAASLFFGNFQVSIDNMYLLSIFKNLLSDSAMIAVQCAQWGKIYDLVQTCWCDQHSTKVYCCTNQTISIHTKPCWTLQSGQNLPFLRLQTCWRQSTQYASSIRLKSYQTKL